MRPRTIALVLALLISIVGTAHAIGISPSGKEIPYLPGEEARVMFTAINNGGTPVVFDISTDGELAGYTTVEKRRLILAPQSAKAFSVVLKIPKELDPGTHSTQIIITEGSTRAGQVSGRASVISSIEFFVPFFGKYVKAKLNPKTVNIGEPVDFALEIRNLGNETINSAGSTISIFEGNEKIGFADTNSIADLGPLAGATLSAQWMPSKSGDFIAIADVIYDGLSTQAKASFRVGRMLVNIVDITYDEIFAGTIGKVYVKLESKSNSKLDGVFTELFVYKDGEFLTRINGKPFALLPWDIYTDTIYVDTKGFEPGVYDGKIIVHYGDRQAEQAFKLALRNKKAFDTTVYAIIIVLAISMAALFAIYARQGSRRKR